MRRKAQFMPAIAGNSFFTKDLRKTNVRGRRFEGFSPLVRERADRRRGREKGGERVAAVEILRASSEQRISGTATGERAGGSVKDIGKTEHPFFVQTGSLRGFFGRRFVSKIC